MTIVHALLMPVAGLLTALGALVAGRAGQVLLILGAVLFGVAAILPLT